ncbi:hypothetical protein XOC_4015 [Xanthomonas oryzae pv. oryzicola BLS256]|uniref:Uncharacterized protein n=1 Tax=Xanthomonas oryzae pv. oryzicola (strain BLS256) TaxID=383407 RepID=G7TIJ0_XANOB|nr:hypothetical protein XOC_4015 [Xanthomonas oryzae pv. oryzicola BLS256]
MLDAPRACTLRRPRSQAQCKAHGDRYTNATTAATDLRTL